MAFDIHSEFHPVLSPHNTNIFKFPNLCEEGSSRSKRQGQRAPSTVHLQAEAVAVTMGNLWELELCLTHGRHLLMSVGQMRE
jgi:hypothetical protein